MQLKYKDGAKLSVERGEMHIAVDQRLPPPVACAARWVAQRSSSDDRAYTSGAAARAARIERAEIRHEAISG